MGIRLLHSSNNFRERNCVQSERPQSAWIPQYREEASRNRVLAVGSEGGLGIGRGSPLEIGSGSSRESFDLRIRAT